MLKKFSKSIAPLFALIGLIAPEVQAEIVGKPCCPVPPGHFYLGIFGGGGAPNNPTLTQKGIAFFPAASGGALDVNARGNANNNSAWIGGLHVGYEQGGLTLDPFCPGWEILSALEVEGYYLGLTQNGALINPTTRVPEHDFHDRFPISAGVILANAVWTLKIPDVDWLDVYAGGGIGSSITSISGAHSKQVRPPEPGINHFNSNTRASDWAFAAQAKAGMHFLLSPNWRLFAEYRLLYIASTQYTFGATVYPTHVPTTRWNVNMASATYNMGSAGIDYVF